MSFAKWPSALSTSRRLAFVPLARPPPLRHVSYHFPPPPPRLRFIKRPVFWILPIAGGISLYFYPRPQPVLSQLVSSPTLIPCPPPESATSDETLILSPSENYLSPTERISALFVDHIWEPILTARRFVHLFFLFIPVIISSPMLLVGSPEERLQGDKWGAVWWYDYLVARMDRAGPTFIKVRGIVSFFWHLTNQSSSAACPVGSFPCRFISRSVVRTYGQDAFSRKTAFSYTYKARHRTRLPKAVRGCFRRV